MESRLDDSPVPCRVLEMPNVRLRLHVPRCATANVYFDTTPEGAIVATRSALGAITAKRNREGQLTERDSTDAALQLSGLRVSDKPTISDKRGRRTAYELGSVIRARIDGGSGFGGVAPDVALAQMFKPESLVRMTGPNSLNGFDSLILNRVRRTSY